MLSERATREFDQKLAQLFALVSDLGTVARLPDKVPSRKAERPLKRKSA